MRNANAESQLTRTEYLAPLIAGMQRCTNVDHGSAENTKGTVMPAVNRMWPLSRVFWSQSQAAQGCCFGA